MIDCMNELLSFLALMCIALSRVAIPLIALFSSSVFSIKADINRTLELGNSTFYCYW